MPRATLGGYMPGSVYSLLWARQNCTGQTNLQGIYSVPSILSSPSKHHLCLCPPAVLISWSSICFFCLLDSTLLTRCCLDYFQAFWPLWVGNRAPLYIMTPLVNSEGHVQKFSGPKCPRLEDQVSDIRFLGPCSKYKYKPCFLLIASFWCGHCYTIPLLKFTKKRSISLFLLNAFVCCTCIPL